MSDQLTLASEARDRVGKGASRALRRDGRVPAVIYGQNQAPEAVHVEEKALTRLLATGHFMNSVVMVGGVRTLPKDVAFHPVTDRPVHVDFLRVGEHTQVTVAVPVVFTGEEDAPYSAAGGVLNVVAHEIELVVDAADIPTEIEVPLAGRAVGDTIHLSDVALPEGAEPASSDPELTVATVVPPTVPTAADEAADLEAGVGVSETDVAGTDGAEGGEATDATDAPEGEAQDDQPQG